MSLVELKLIGMAMIFGIAVIGGLTALRLKALERGRIWLSRGGVLAAGVFLGAGLIHLLGDSVETFGGAFPGLTYPAAFALAGAACLIMLLLDKVITSAQKFEGRKTVSDSYILLIILSIHSVLVGAALGAEDELVGSIALFLAVMAHKGSAAFALAVSLTRDRINHSRLVKSVLLFSLMTPLGVLLGITGKLVTDGAAAHMFEAIFDGLAGGTFIYIASLDIIEEEFDDSREIWLKYSLVCAGFLLMALLALWT